MPRNHNEPPRQVYKMTAADYQILEAGKKDPNHITDYYMRTPTSGTRWMRKPVPFEEEKARGWQVLNAAWLKDDRPERIFMYQDIEYTMQWDEDGYPIFWHHHGWLWQDWQKEWFLCQQPEVTVIGGFGSGKTAAIAAILCTLAMTTPGFRGFAVAPQMIQAMEVYKYIMNNFKQTLFFERFVWNYPKKPYPQFIMQSDYIGESTIEILSIEHDPEKVRTLEGDIIFLDQAEKIMELDDLIRDLGSRLRGQVNGRAKLGKLNLVANAGDNPQLWMRYDMHEWEPEVYKSFNVASWNNAYLSKQDIDSMKRRVGGETSDIDQWMAGKRPMGKGEHFPPDMVRDCTDDSLDHIMDHANKVVAEAREEIELSHGKTNIHLEAMPEYYFVKKSSQKIGVYQWEMPPDHKAGRQYVTIADTGQANPPDRNSAVIMTWDITDFPGKPAFMRGFNWVFGNGSYWPFLNEYERTVKLYKTQGRNAFDSTGMAKGFDELVFVMMNLHAEGLNMAGNGKFLALNAAKMFMGKRLMLYPYISHLSNQLTNYVLPDNKIRQDLVMTICMSALYMRRYYWEEAHDDEDGVPVESYVDRHARPITDRHKRNTRHR
jgi:hypothetical protein